MRAGHAGWAVATVAWLCATHAQAEAGARAAEGTRFELAARSETYAELFQRALLPGAAGAIVRTSTAAPLQQYVSVRAREVDADPHADKLDLELSAWGRAWLGARGDEPLLDGDVQTLNLHYQHGPLGLRLGRQVVAGGAARYARFDGVAVDAELGEGFSARAYGGFTVLPRWNQRPGYEQLGAAVDTLVRDPQALPDPSRADYWLGGGRLAWTSSARGMGLSFHEQRENGGLSHRNFGLDAYEVLGERASFGANAVMDLERARFADARAFLDARLDENIDGSLEYLHTEPALFLSHQSVLSVFGSSSYDEAGGLARVRPLSWLRLDASAFADFYPDQRAGGRGEVSARMFADPRQHTLVRLGYARVQAPENGYHSLRGGLSQRFQPTLTGTLEAYLYAYDHAIRSYRASSVYAATLSYDVSHAAGLLFGGSLASSPYASLDAQAQVRFVYQLDASSRGRWP